MEFPLSSTSFSAHGRARTDRLIAIVLVLLTLPVILLWKRATHLVTVDVNFAFLPWLAHIEQFGRLTSLESSFSTYTPPYIYLLSLASLLRFAFSPVVIIRLSAIVFTVLTAALGYDTCRALGCSALRALLAGWLLLVAPEVFANGVIWGQCDSVHTFFLLLFFRLMLSRRPAWAMVMLGVALSIKLQAIFMGPAVLALLLVGEIPFWTVLFIPLSYVLVMVPAALAGRPWKQLLLVYGDQYGIYQTISMNAANPYQLLLHWAKYSEHLTTVFTRAGLVVGAFATLGLVVFLVRLRPLPRGWRLLLALSLSLVVEPFVLPKMHERYFFAGDTLMLILAVACPRVGAWPAALLQVAALMAYYPYLQHPMGPAFFAGACTLVVVAMTMMIRPLLRKQSETGELAYQDPASRISTEPDLVI